MAQACASCAARNRYTYTGCVRQEAPRPFMQ